MDNSKQPVKKEKKEAYNGMEGKKKIYDTKIK